MGNIHWWVKLEVWSEWSAGEMVDTKSLVAQEVVEVNQISQLYLFLMFYNNSSLLFQTLVIQRIINIQKYDGVKLTGLHFRYSWCNR